MITLRTLSLSICSTLVLAAFTTSEAADRQRIIVGGPSTAVPTGALWSTSHYVDFDARSATASRKWTTAPPFNDTAYFFRVVGPQSSGWKCYDVATAKLDAETVEADTRFFGRNSSNTQGWKPVNDDWSGRYSKMRVWSIEGKPVELYVAPYVKTLNKIDFYLIISGMPYTTFNDCLYGGGVNGKPFAMVYTDQGGTVKVLPQ